MSVYFIQAGESGPIKIGLTSGDAKRRMRNLQTPHYETLRLLGVIEGDVDAEIDWQARFKHCHKRGEWFEPTPDLLLAISKAVSLGRTPEPEPEPEPEEPEPETSTEWIARCRHEWGPGEPVAEVRRRALHYLATGEGPGG